MKAEASSIESDILNYFLEAREVLNKFLEGEYRKVERVCHIIADAIKRGNKVIACGNGGSMCDAMHLAEELTGRFRNDRAPYPAVAISDPSYLTCTANDFGFEYVFSRFVEGVGEKGDVLVAISTSGNSKNVIEAVHAAKKKGMITVALTGKGGGTLKTIADVSIDVPWQGYADHIQEIHIKVIHAIILGVEKLLKGENAG